MYLNTVNSPDIIEKLKCAICDNFLSYFAIYIDTNKQNVCGRCPRKKLYVRNNVYEILARQIEFPCRFVKKGCSDRFLPKHIPDHEKQCAFRTVHCPTKRFTGCLEHETFPNLKQHCEDHHPDLFMKDLKFEIKLRENKDVEIRENKDVEIRENKDVQIQENEDVEIRENEDVEILENEDVEVQKNEDVEIRKNENVEIRENEDVGIRENEDVGIRENEPVHRLLQNENCLFEFSWKYIPSSRRFRCTISLLEDPEKTTSYFYSVVLKNENRTFTLTGCLGKYTSRSDIHKTCLDGLIDSSCYTDDDIIEGYISIEEKIQPQIRHIDQNLADLFKCVTCQIYVKPPVGIYLSGQSKCNSCGSGKSDSGTLIRNDTLDKIASLSIYPCNFSKNGCKFTAGPVLMQKHESHCPYKSKICPINEYQACNWTGCEKDTKRHILDNHGTIMESFSEISENVENSFENYRIIIHSNNIFLLVSRYVINSQYCWAVQKVVGEFENNLKFEIEVLDGKNSNNKLMARQNCVALTNKKQNFQSVDHYCYFTYDQIKNLITAEKKLIYRIRIVT